MSQTLARFDVLSNETLTFCVVSGNHMFSPQICRFANGSSVMAWVLLLTSCVYAQDYGARLYPNELKGFEFYERHLSPLRPYVSDQATVVQLFGSDQGKEMPGWRVAVYWIGDYKSNIVNGHLWRQDISGRLASLDLIPKKPISMRCARFPSAFSHSVGGVSEINVSCDVYTDDFGLEYWIYAEDSKTAKRGDLMRIIYGPSKRLRLEGEGE
jgi:hypothetical protein